MVRARSAAVGAALGAPPGAIRIARFTWADLDYPPYIPDVVRTAGRQTSSSR